MKPQKLWRFGIVAFAAVLGSAVLGPATAQISVRLSEICASPDSSILIPLYVGDLSGKDVTSFEFVVSCDTSVLRLTGIDQAGTVSFGLMMFANNRVRPFHPGLMKVVCASAKPLSGDGILVYLTAIAKHKDGFSPVQVSSFLFNRGTPQAEVKNGMVRVSRLLSKK